MSTRYYRVIKENFLWEVGCILYQNTNLSSREYHYGYQPIDDLFKKHEGDEFITGTIIENSPEYFERVYKVDLVTQTVYEIKEKAKELLQRKYKSV